MPLQTDTLKLLFANRCDHNLAQNAINRTSVLRALKSQSQPSVVKKIVVGTEPLNNREEKSVFSVLASDQLVSRTKSSTKSRNVG